MKAKKSLGQNFLKSEKALDAIVETGEISPDDTVLEIGPGKGALTEKLLATGAKVIAIEKDDDLYEFLEGKFAKEISSKQLELAHEDILEFQASEALKLRSYKLISNIPYNITGQIIRKFLSADKQPAKMVLLVQKEVAERIVASKESLLSLSVKVYGTPRYIAKVSKGAFVPMPQVDSAIISIENISKSFFANIDEKKIFEMLKAGFSSKRKKLSSNLSTIFGKTRVSEVFEKLDLDENIRAEDVGIEIFKKLAQNLYSQ